MLRGLMCIFLDNMVEKSPMIAQGVMCIFLDNMVEKSPMIAQGVNVYIPG